jgi:hypothetical protein
LSSISDLDAVEARVKSHGYTTHSHDDYEPGRRFYFDDDERHRVRGGQLWLTWLRPGHWSTARTGG